MRIPHLLWMALAGGLLATGCRGVPTTGEKAARQELATVTDKYRPGAGDGSSTNRPGLPVLTDGGSMSNFLAFALLNSPGVAAAYEDWSAAVERITVARSRPDPKLTFSAYIQNDLTSLMPGLMQDLPGPGKLKSAAGVATAESRAQYFAFETALLQAAFEFKRAYFNLYYLEERLRINRRTLALLTDLEMSARAQNEVGKASLQDVYRAQMDRDQLRTDIASLEDSRGVLLARYKAALGLTRAQADPPLPAPFTETPLDLTGDELLKAALANNPRLQAAAAEVALAEASMAQARKSKVPDFSAGLQAEVYEPPFYWPQAGMTLPLWRDKLAAELAAAQAGRRAAGARLTAEQIGLAVDVAARTYDYRESTRNLTLLEGQLIPKAQKSLELARASYLSGRVDFSNLREAERTWLNFQLTEIQERERREIALAELSLVIAGQVPAGAPVRGSNPLQ